MGIITLTEEDGSVRRFDEKIVAPAESVAPVADVPADVAPIAPVEQDETSPSDEQAQ